MPGKEVLRRLALLIALMLVLVACANDPETEAEPSEDGAASEEATEEASEEASEDASEDASEEGSESASASEGVVLSELCEEEYADVTAPEDFSVGLVTDIGSVDDGTFNQYAYEGMQAAADCFGFETDFVETQNTADYANNINSVLSSEPDVVVTVGFLIADATLEASTANTEVNFIGVDQFQPEYPDNYAGIQFREDQGGFLAGVLAAELTESDVVGVVGGREDVPPVVRFVNGFQAGAEYVNPDIQVLSVYNESFEDPTGGASDAQQMLGEGADVIFGAGGETGSGGVRAAAEAGQWGIGVDQDEYFTTFSGGSAPGADRLATSAIKRVDLGVFELIASAVQEEFQSGLFELSAENLGITYAPFHDADVPEEAAARLEEVRAGLADGSIETGIDPVTGLPE